MGWGGRSSDSPRMFDSDVRLVRPTRLRRAERRVSGTKGRCGLPLSAAGPVPCGTRTGGGSESSQAFAQRHSRESLRPLSRTRRTLTDAQGLRRSGLMLALERFSRGAGRSQNVGGAPVQLAGLQSPSPREHGSSKGDEIQQGPGVAAGNGHQTPRTFTRRAGPPGSWPYGGRRGNPRTGPPDLRPWLRFVRRGTLASGPGRGTPASEGGFC